VRTTGGLSEAILPEIVALDFWTVGRRGLSWEGVVCGEVEGRLRLSDVKVRSALG
jgi:hypothetical protein